MAPPSQVDPTATTPLSDFNLSGVGPGDEPRRRPRIAVASSAAPPTARTPSTTHERHRHVVAAAALLPAVRQVEIAAARTLLGTELPDVCRPHAWDSRRPLAASRCAWLAILCVIGVVDAMGVLYFLPLGVGLLAHPFTGIDRLRWPGNAATLHTGSSRLLRALAATVIGPTLHERVAGAAQRELDLARANALARDVHDGIGHTLTAMTLQASAARRLMRRDPTRPTAPWPRSRISAAGPAAGRRCGGSGIPRCARGPDECRQARGKQRAPRRSECW